MDHADAWDAAAQPARPLLLPVRAFFWWRPIHPTPAVGIAGGSPHTPSAYAYPPHTLQQNSFHDVLSTDDWALAMVGQPVLAVLFLFPVKDVSEAHRREEAERVKREGQVVSPQVFYMTQEIGNACGTVRLLMWIVVIGSSHWAFFVVSTDQYVG